MKKADRVTEAVRWALVGSSRVMAMDFYAIWVKVERRLQRVVGRAKLYGLLASLKQAGEVGTVGRGAERRYYVKGR